MACIRKRRGKYVVDYRDGAGIRRWVTCETRGEAETVLVDKSREARQPTRPVVDPNITMSAYVERWLREIAVTTTWRFGCMAFRSAGRRKSECSRKDVSFLVERIEMPKSGHGRSVEGGRESARRAKW